MKKKKGRRMMMLDRGQGLRLERGSGELGARKRIGGELKTLNSPSARRKEAGGGGPPING